MSQLPLLPADQPTRQPSATHARILAFNVQHSAPQRARRQAAWLAAQDEADLIILTEVGHGPGANELLIALVEHGYTHLLAASPQDGDYRTVLASRSAPLARLEHDITVLTHRAPAATVTIAGHTVGLLGLYVPSRGPKEHRNEAKRAFQDAVATALPALVDRVDGPLVVMGDLNVVEPGHVPHHRVFGQWEYDFYSAFDKSGLTDAYRACHPAGGDHSWFGRSGRGFRFDHAFLTADHLPLLTECRYLHQPRLEGLSDHAALCLTLDPARIAPAAS